MMHLMQQSILCPTHFASSRASTKASSVTIWAVLSITRATNTSDVKACVSFVDIGSFSERTVPSGTAGYDTMFLRVTALIAYRSAWATPHLPDDPRTLLSSKFASDKLGIPAREDEVARVPANLSGRLCAKRR